MIPPPYTSRDGAEGFFHDHATFEQWLSSLKTRKNIILQGPPGVGKTFVARRLAYALMGQKDTRRTEMVQFHQSYAYEDFIQGYRPSSSAGFELQNGAFYRFARQAQQGAGQRHVFLIDEINRGNLSKIFGELMMLIEPDKRGPGHAMSLTYQETRHDDFYVPENLYLIGMMNTADRSLAMVDYALRRRFRFIDMEPQFGALFQNHLRTCGASGELIEEITRRVQALNKTIADDSTLGPGFQIGHSYFCPRDNESPNRAWYERVIRHEIGPLLREYWFDAPDKAATEVDRLLA
jgi:5-methylcytosine-specific restriction protein B